MKVEEVWNLLQYKMYILEDPCGNCASFECKKNCMKELLQKKYAKMDIIDYKDCLKRKKKHLKEIYKLRRSKEFNKYSHEPCVRCKKKFFIDDLGIELVKEEKYFTMERICKNCKKHQKK